MRNLKKILALVLALVMSMSLVSVAGAKYTVSFDDADQIAAEYMEAAAVLEGIKVYQGDEGKFLPKDTITRAEVATIVYRIVTGDVEGKDVKLYADMNKFADCEDHWAVGYINFCANQNIVQGYNPTTFGPDDAITGYQAVLMLLRAIGWDKNGESNSDDWRQISAGKAQLMGWTTGISEYQLSQDASREMVAQILLRAIQQPQLSWTLLTDYSEYSDLFQNNLNKSLAEENFKLAYDGTVDHTIWGRPFHAWYIDRDEDGVRDLNEAVVAKDMYVPTVTYTEAVAECDIYEDMGLRASTYVNYLTVNGYSDGYLVRSTYDNFDGVIEATKTKQLVGAQGRLTEIYETYNEVTREYYTEIVMIDEFFAVVDDVTELKVDKNDHIEKYATLYLTVYDGNEDNENGATAVQLSSKTNWDYEIGDVLLLNAETVGNSKNSAVRDRGPLADRIEIVGTPEFISEFQTHRSTKDSHWVGDEEIPDAIRFVLNQAGNETSLKHYWFFDSYDNLIAATDISTDNTYAVITSIKWVDSNEDLEDGYALAKLTYMDGTPENVVLYSIDDVVLTGVEGKLADLEDGLVSSTKQYNKAEYVNTKLYMVEETVKGLNLVPMNKFGANAKAWPGVPAMTTAINATNTTKFLMFNGEYTTFTGINSIPEKLWAGNFWYVDKNGDNHAEYVFLGNPVTATSTPTSKTTYHVFFCMEDDRLIVKTKLTADKEEYFQISGGLVDAEDGVLNVKKANEELKDYILANKGEVLRVTVTDGYVTAVTEVDNNGMTVTGGKVIWAGPATAATTTLINGVLVANNRSYNVEGHDYVSYDGGLSYSMKWDDDAQLFLVFSEDTKEEKNVSMIYITDKAGVPYQAPTDERTDLEKLVDTMDSKLTALKNAVSDVNDLIATSAANSNNKYAKAVKTIKTALTDYVKADYALNSYLATAAGIAAKAAQPELTNKINELNTIGDLYVVVNAAAANEATALSTAAVDTIVTNAAKTAIEEGAKAAVKAAAEATAANDAVALAAANSDLLAIRNIAKTNGVSNNYTVLDSGYAAALAVAEAGEKTEVANAAVETLKTEAAKALKASYTEKADYADEMVYVIKGDADVNIDAALTKHYNLNKAAFVAALNAIIADTTKGTSDITSLIATYAGTIATAAWGELYNELAVAKRTAIEGAVAALLSAYNSKNFSTADWNALVAIKTAAEADVMAATTKTGVTTVVTTAQTAVTTAAAAFAAAYGQADMDKAEAAIKATGAVYVADPATTTDAAVEAVIAGILNTAKITNVTADAVVTINRDGTTALVTLTSSVTGVVAPEAFTITVGTTPATTPAN